MSRGMSLHLYNLPAQLYTMAAAEEYATMAGLDTNKDNMPRQMEARSLPPKAPKKASNPTKGKVTPAPRNEPGGCHPQRERH